MSKGKDNVKNKPTAAAAKTSGGKNRSGTSTKGKSKSSTSSALDGDSNFYIPPQNKWPVKIVRLK